MSTEAMREAFERFAVARNLDLTEGRFGGYFLADTAAAWAAWQATTANQEALIKAALEAAAEAGKDLRIELSPSRVYSTENLAEKVVEHFAEAIRQITPQQVMERMK